MAVKRFTVRDFADSCRMLPQGIAIGFYFRGNIYKRDYDSWVDIPKWLYGSKIYQWNIKPVWPDGKDSCLKLFIPLVEPKIEDDAVIGTGKYDWGRCHDISFFC